MEFRINILESFFIGTMATIAIDIWAIILKKIFNLPTTNWGMVGRWFGHIPRGTLVHRPIGAAAEIRYENAIGWGLHYVIGIIYAYLYLFLVFDITTNGPSLGSAILFGLATVVVPWFVLQPGLGLGVLARCTEKPNLIRSISLSVHTIFGASLYFGWLITSLFLSTSQ